MRDRQRGGWRGDDAGPLLSGGGRFGRRLGLGLHLVANVVDVVLFAVFLALLEDVILFVENPESLFGLLLFDIEQSAFALFRILSELPVLNLPFLQQLRLLGLIDLLSCPLPIPSSLVAMSCGCRLGRNCASLLNSVHRTLMLALSHYLN